MASFVRQPSAFITLGGVLIECESVSVGQPKKARSGTCSIKASMTQMIAAGMGLDVLASLNEVPVSVSYAMGSGDQALMFQGTLDHCEVAFSGSGQVVSLTGRDMTTGVHAAKTNEKFINQTSEQIAQTIAGRHGLSAQTDGGTTTAGSIYTAEQAHMTNNLSEWDLLRHLGEREGKVTAVYGSNLYFKKIDDSSLPIYAVLYVPPTPFSPAQSSGPNSGLTTITLSRNYQAAKKTTVKVKSWDHKKKQLITSTQSSGSDGPEQTYTYFPHHRTQAAADNHAKGKLKEHTRHEFDVKIDMPGDVTLTPFFQIALSGTGSAFDQNYSIDHIDHKIDKGGYTMSISTKAAKKGRNPS